MVTVQERDSQNPVLRRILSTHQVTDGTVVLNLNHPDTPGRDSHLHADEGLFLQRVIEALRPSVTLEVGMAYGISTLFLCEALKRSSGERAIHYALDPFQSTLWRGIGRSHVAEAGYDSMVRVIEERSEFALPELVRRGVRLDFALIDGWHTFDQVMVEFYYINRMLNVGGVVAFDDAARPAINRVIRYAINYDAYAVYGGQPFAAAVTWKGRARRVLGSTRLAKRLLRRDVLQPDWELGVRGTCIALQKVREDDGRTSGWYRDF
jgi:predicted O-methyltransferase YrrM